MSVHKSLKVKNRHMRKRNVLNREERIDKLQTGERWAEGDSVFGLPKVRVYVQAPRSKAAKEKPEEAEATEGAEGTEGAGEAAEESKE